MDPAEHPCVTAARRLAAAMAATAADIELAGRLPDDLVEAIADAGLFQQYLPAALGGPECHPLDAFAVTEALARVDGSVAWCVSISTALSQYLAWFDPDLLARWGGAPPDFRLAGSARPLGRAVACAGGYRVTGRWDFASNVLHAGWYVGTCVVVDGTDTDKTRAVIVPVHAGAVDPVWDALGMRGTGSHDFVLDDVFVPGEQLASYRLVRSRPERLFHPRLTGIITWSPTAGVALGLARGALDAFADLAGEGSTRSPSAVRFRPDAQHAVGRAEAVVGAARAYVIETVGDAWDAVVGERPPEAVDAAIARARLAITHAMGEAVRAVDGLLEVAGTGGVFRRSGLERRFRDVHTAARHAAGLTAHVEAAGRVFLGLPADAPYF